MLSTLEIIAMGTLSNANLENLRDNSGIDVDKWLDEYVVGLTHNRSMNHIFHTHAIDQFNNTGKKQAIRIDLSGVDLVEMCNTIRTTTDVPQHSHCDISNLVNTAYDEDSRNMYATHNIYNEYFIIVVCVANDDIYHCIKRTHGLDIVNHKYTTS